MIIDSPLHQKDQKSVSGLLMLTMLLLLMNAT
jgi:hypothetical protein